MDFPAMTQLISNFGIAIILAAGFLFVVHRFVTKTMPEIAETQAKALAEQRKDLMLIIEEQREGGKRVVDAILARLEKMDGDLTSIKHAVTGEKRS